MKDPRGVIEATLAEGSEMESQLREILEDFRVRFDGAEDDPVYVEIRTKLEDLLAAEASSDLGWMDLGSWYVLPYAVRDLFDRIIDPFIWGRGGVYFRLTRFFQRGFEVISAMSDSGVAIVKHRGNVRFMPFAVRRNVDWDLRSLVRKRYEP